MRSLLLRCARGAYALAGRPLVRRIPSGLRRVLSLELVGAPSAVQADLAPRGLPVIPTTPEQELYLGYLKAFMVDHQRVCPGPSDER